MFFFSSALNAIGAGRRADVKDELREFLSLSAIRALLGKTGDPSEEFMRSEQLLIFDTSTQHTWLLATNAALYCVVDNRRQAHARKLWRIARSDIERDGNFILTMGEAELTDRDSYLIIGEQRPRKFTKRLFETLSIKLSILNMLKNAFSAKALVGLEARFPA